MTDTLSNLMISEWLAIHNTHYDNLQANHRLETPRPEETLIKEFHVILNQYFEKYPDQWTDYYHDMLRKK